MTKLTLPLLDGLCAYVEAEFPMAESQWDQMMNVLTAMKPGLITSSSPIVSGEDPDMNQLATFVVNAITDQRDPVAVTMGIHGGIKGGNTRKESLTPERRKEIASNAAKTRWDKINKKPEKKLYSDRKVTIANLKTSALAFKKEFKAFAFLDLADSLGVERITSPEVRNKFIAWCTMNHIEVTRELILPGGSKKTYMFYPFRMEKGKKILATRMVSK